MATNMNLSKIKQTFGLGDTVQTPRLVTQLKQQYGLNRNNEFVPSTAAENANETAANNRTSENMQTKRGIFSNNPYLNRQGNLINPYLNYQQLADDKRTNSRIKQFIREATGITPTQSESAPEQTTSNDFGIERAKNTNNAQTTDFSAWDAEKLKNTDLTQLPKLSEEQISSLISKYFSKSGSVMNTSDAAGIYQAQAQSGISALALLGIGALESGYGTSNIARQKGNLWGWGAVNSNPMGGAKTFSSNAGAAAVEYAKNLKSLYYDQRGAKSIYAIGTGDNPSGLGYAYLDDEKTIDTRWPAQVGDIMAQFTKSLSGSPATSGSTDTGKGNRAVDIAKQFLGTPYVWGGETPDGFDCSGLMQYVYKKMGYDISRTTYTQIHDGTAVNKANLQPGDLVFFGNASSPHHVGMYIGNGQYLHAPKTGDVVKISDLNARSDYAGARRIIN